MVLISRKDDKMNHLLFVYGTIRVIDKKGHPISAEMLAERVASPEAYLNGFKMLHLGRFPGLIEGVETDRVRGEIHHIASPDYFDNYEGCYPDDLVESLYIRKQVNVEVDGALVGGVWVYIFNAEHMMHHFADNHAPAIESGDWFKEEGLYDGDTDTGL
jgi:gamma-glutamylcyclotransferase (GGCT)/AIG2-like uncharacterized protein YtfP